jgi:hypothetical protein
MRNTTTDTDRTDGQSDRENANPLESLDDELQTEADSADTDSVDADSSAEDDAAESRPNPVRESLDGRLTVNLYEDIAVRSSAMFDSANATVKLHSDTGTSIEKNRHWYPLIFELGLDAIDDMDDDQLVAELLAYDS